MKNIFIISVGSFLLLAISAVGQQHAEGLELSELSLEEKNASLSSTLTAYQIALIQWAKQQGQSAEEAGIYMGRFFAPAWPEKLTPAGFTSWMNHGWGKYSIKQRCLL